MRASLLLLLLAIVAQATAVEYRPLVMGADGKPRQFPDGTDQLRVVPIAGLDASKPAAAAGNTGLLYLATDTLKIYRSTGATWTHIGAPAGAAGGDLVGTYPSPQVAQASAAGGFAVTATTPSIAPLTGALRVAGGAGIAGAVVSGNSLNVFRDGSDSPGVGAYVALADTAVANYWLNQLSASNHLDWWAVIGGSSHIMRLKNDGELLLGTTTDYGAYRLQVSGNQRIEGTLLDFNATTTTKQINAYGGGDLELVTRTSGDSVRIYTGASTLAATFGSTQALTTVGPVITPAATTSIPSIRLPHGTAPSSPTNGDMWTTTTALAARINGATATMSGTNTGDQTITLTGNVTGSGTGSFATTIANDAVTNAHLNNMATQTFKGRTTAGTGDPEDLTVAQATALLDTFTTSLKGLAPASGGGTTNFLRADGTWAAPAGGGSGDSTHIFSQRGDSSNIGAASVSELSLIDTTPSTGTLTLAANQLTEGSVLRVRASGTYRTNGTPNVTFKIKYGATVVCGTTTGASVNTSSNDRPWTMEANIVTRTTGASASVVGRGAIDIYNGTGFGALQNRMMMWNFSPATVDTTGTLAVDATIQFGTSDSNNYINTTQLTIELLTP